MKTQEQKEKARFEEWRATKHFTYVNDVENCEVFTQRTGIEHSYEQAIKDLNSLMLDDSKVLGYFTYEDGATIIMTEHVKFYAFRYDPWSIYETAEEKMWQKKSSKTYKVETPFKNVIKRLYDAGITPGEIEAIVFVDMWDVLQTMHQNNMDFNDLLKMMQANDIDGNDTEHFVEKFDNHIEMISECKITDPQ